MSLLMVIYFGAGLLRDALGTMFYRAVSGKWVWSASALAGGITLYDLLVIATILTDWKVANAVAYGVGCAVGTFIVLKRRTKSK